jgi:L-lactate dehydrogenase complex protein LldE
VRNQRIIADPEPPLSQQQKHVQLFHTCLIDNFHPEVGIAVVEVLEKLGFRIDVPDGQICCGQPAYNSGFHDETRKVARHTIDVLSSTNGPIVIPSGSCTDMLVNHIPVLFRDEYETKKKALKIASRCFELSQFLVDEADFEDRGSSLPAKVAYHPSCHLSRGIGVRSQPTHLLEMIDQLELVEIENQDECCGFGGTFSVTQPEISGAMLDKKLKAVENTGAEILAGCDMGCLMHIKGGLRRRGIPVEVLHLAQILSRSWS